MKTRHFLKRYGIPVVSIVLFFIWLGQQKEITNKDFRNHDLPESILQQYERRSLESSSGQRSNNGSSAARKRVSQTASMPPELRTSAVKEYTVAIPVKRLAVTTRPVDSVPYSMHTATNVPQPLPLIHSTSQPSQSIVAKQSLISVVHNSTTNEKQQQVLQKENDYDSNGNLLFVQNLAKVNFVRVNVSEASEQEKHRPSSSAYLQRDGNQHNLRVSKTKESVQKPKVNDRLSIPVIDNELDAFAAQPTLPDYDLPLLKDDELGKSTNGSTDQKQKSSVFVWPPVDVNNSVQTADADVISGNTGNDSVGTDDDIMSSAIVFGEISPEKMYSVFSTTTDNREALGFIFLLPLTTLAWKRIGFESVIVIVGSVDTWNSNELFHFVLSSVRELGAVVVFLEPRPEKSIMISQVSRIFIANVLRARAAFANRRHPDVIDDVYIVTTDTDIWPIYGNAYTLPKGKAILSLNSECCGAFSHRGSTHRMLPMANIGMKIGTWRQLTRRFGHSPQSVDDILTYVVREFGPVALRPVHKGENVGWFIDQMMISLLVTAWSRENNATATAPVKYVPRDVGVDRIDRNAWNPGGGVTVDDKIDAHLLENAYLPGVWVQLLPLMRALYGYETDRYAWCTRYYDSFQKLFVAVYQSSEIN